MRLKASGILAQGWSGGATQTLGYLRSDLGALKESRRSFDGSPAHFQRTELTRREPRLYEPGLDSSGPSGPQNQEKRGDELFHGSSCLLV